MYRLTRPKIAGCAPGQGLQENSGGPEKNWGPLKALQIGKREKSKRVWVKNLLLSKILVEISFVENSFGKSTIFLTFYTRGTPISKSQLHKKFVCSYSFTIEYFTCLKNKLALKNLN